MVHLGRLFEAMNEAELTYKMMKCSFVGVKLDFLVTLLGEEL